MRTSSLPSPWAASLCAVLLSLGACSVEKYVTGDNPIYTGATVELANPELAEPSEKALVANLTSLVKVEATNERAAFFWFKYNTPKEKGLKRKLRNLLGEEPVYYDEAPLVRTQLVMQDYLKDHGYFGSVVQFDTIRPDTFRVEAKFLVTTEGRSKIDSVVLPTDSIELTRFIADVKDGSRIKKGDYYSIAALGAERVRLDQLTARKGYFEFAPSNVFYFVDSTAGTKRVKVWMRLDKGSDSLALSRFRIGETYVYPEYSLTDTSTRLLDTVLFDGVHVLQSGDASVDAAVLARRIGLREGDLYDRTIYENTVNQFLDLGVFKFVNYKLERRTTDSIPTLDQYIYLTQSQTRDINVDVSAASKVNQALGLGVTFRYGDRNFLGGAEDFRVSLGVNAGPQAGIVDPTEAVFAQEFTLNTSIALPRLIAPYSRSLERRAYYIPRTTANLRYQLTNRTDFTLQNAGLQLGYLYRANKLTTHTFYPFSASYTSLIGQSDEFDAKLAQLPLLQNTFADNAIVGSEYKINYNEQSVATTRSFWFVDGGIKTSGNVAMAFAKESAEGGPNAPKEIGGVALSQFFKTYVDGRRTQVYGNNKLATRAYLGAALPYGNTDYIPFIEQFFAGGPNSIRAFQVRGLGPGARLPAVLDSTNANQSGDIRLELNAEYRFPIVSFLEGAAFVDAGNVWLAKSTPENSQPEGRPDGVFQFDSFFNEIAIGTGLGLRLNFDVIIVRLDASVPIRKPWLPLSEAFDLKALNVLDRDTRQENLQLHIAIGYPF